MELLCYRLATALVLRSSYIEFRHCGHIHLPYCSFLTRVVYAVVVCLSVRLSQAGIVSKRLDGLSGFCHVL